MSDLCKLWNEYLKLTEYIPVLSSPFLCLPSGGRADWYTSQKNKSEGSVPDWPGPFQALWSSLLMLFYLSVPKKERDLEANVT